MHRWRIYLPPTITDYVVIVLLPSSSELDGSVGYSDDSLLKSVALIVDAGGLYLAASPVRVLLGGCDYKVSVS